MRLKREEAKVSMAQLGKLAGVSKQYVYMMEAGQIRPTLPMCIRLAEALEIDSDVVQLLAGHTPPDVLELLQENPQAGCLLIRRALVGR